MSNYMWLVEQEQETNKIKSKRIRELEAEVARLGKVYLEGSEQTRRVLAKEVAENKRLREAVTALAKIAPQNNARAAVLKKLEAGNDTTTNTI